MIVLLNKKGFLILGNLDSGGRTRTYQTPYVLFREQMVYLYIIYRFSFAYICLF